MASDSEGHTTSNAAVVNRVQQAAGQQISGNPSSEQEAQHRDSTHSSC